MTESKNPHLSIYIAAKKCLIITCGWDLAEWLERLTTNAEVATILGSIPASSGIWGAAKETVLNKALKNPLKNLP